MTGHVFAGDAPDRPLQPGEAVRIMTGAMIPSGADCVIGQEDVAEDGDLVRIYRPLRAMQNICLRGEDVAEGQTLALRGQKLHYAHIGMLAGQGMAEAGIFRRPRVAVMGTGDELTPAGVPLAAGKIHDSNSFLLGARLLSLGMRPVLCSCCGDETQSLRDRIQALLEENDMVVTTGGVSVGKRDFMPAAAGLLGGQLLFHGVAVKPGSPVLAMLKGGKILLCLSGNPYAALATFEVLAVPVLKKMGGCSDFRTRRQQGIARGSFDKPGGMRRLVRARLSGQEVFIPPRGHESGMLQTLPECNCMIDLPAGAPPIREGTQLEVILL